MPLTPVGLAGVLIPTLIASGNIGIAVPQFALGVANGVTIMMAASAVTSVDVGVLGVGVTAVPLVVPQPLLLSSLLTGFASTATVGVMAPLLALGLANGLSLGFLQGLITMAHPSVGVGAGVAKLIPASAIPSMISGFASAAMIGPSSVQVATAIGIGLTITFAAYAQPIPIVGAPSILPGAGVGVGKVV